MSVADTSIRAIREHRARGNLSDQQRKIMLFFHSRPETRMTRSELSEALHTRLSSVCGRVNELVKLGFLAEGDARKCRITGRTAHVVSLP